MEAASLWAGVRFTARNGSPEALLTDAAGQGLHLYGISARPGGFCGHCAAWQYQPPSDKPYPKPLAPQQRTQQKIQPMPFFYPQPHPPVPGKCG